MAWPATARARVARAQVVGAVAPVGMVVAAQATDATASGALATVWVVEAVMASPATAPVVAVTTSDAGVGPTAAAVVVAWGVVDASHAGNSVVGVAAAAAAAAGALKWSTTASSAFRDGHPLSGQHGWQLQTDCDGVATSAKRLK